LVIKVKNPNHHTGTFTIRWKSSWIIVEKVYPLSYPKFEKLLLLDEYKVRRSKLYYIREKVGKDAKFRSIIKSGDRNKNLI
jgi:large subunit ribosomal protein L19